MAKRFALIGAAGFVAPRHMRAIKDTGCELVAALDPKDSVGVIDSYFPQADFFVEFERFDRHIDKLRRRGEPIDFVSVCSPNYLHDAHVRFGLRAGADVICEKPVVLNPWNVDALEEMERETGKRVYNVLQLRLHPAVRALRESVQAGPADKIYDVDLTYITSRGRWYHVSWKGEEQKSGGVATNIGVHFFDMLSWVFGPLEDSVVHLNGDDTATGLLRYRRARVRWLLSIDASFLPEAARAAGKRTFRSIEIENRELEFSEGFADLHTETYADVLAGRGFRLSDARPAIETVYRIRQDAPSPPEGDCHPLCAAALARAEEAERRRA